MVQEAGDAHVGVHKAGGTRMGAHGDAQGCWCTRRCTRLGAHTWVHMGMHKVAGAHVGAEAGAAQLWARSCGWSRGEAPCPPGHSCREGGAGRAGTSGQWRQAERRQRVEGLFPGCSRQWGAACPEAGPRAEPGTWPGLRAAGIASHTPCVSTTLQRVGAKASDPRRGSSISSVHPTTKGASTTAWGAEGRTSPRQHRPARGRARRQGPELPAPHTPASPGHRPRAAVTPPGWQPGPFHQRSRQESLSLGTWVLAAAPWVGACQQRLGPRDVVLAMAMCLGSGSHGTALSRQAAQPPASAARKGSDQRSAALPPITPAHGHGPATTTPWAQRGALRPLAPHRGVGLD